MSNDTAINQPYILACIDGASLTQAVCDYAAWLAETYKKPIKFLHVIEHGQYFGPADYSGTIGLGTSDELLKELSDIEESRSKLVRKQGQIMLKAAAEQAKEKGVDADTFQCHGTLSEKLSELEPEIFMAVIGIRGVKHEHSQKALGAQIEGLVRSIRRPMLVVNQEFETPKTFMLAYDGSAAADRGLEFICKNEALKHYPWVVARVTTEADENKALQKAETRMAESGISKVTLESRQEKPEIGLVDCQQDNNVDVTVMGAFSHHPLRGFIFGSFTEKMLKQAIKPLLLIHA
ncbi:MAG TPA: universal stress protein UspA [Gammaproteobacteria bacterium]|nr:universal stress protein UspA [Gammaproteobacteria bacterium]HCK93434.1 universal stress protein UspA [Gammaproteobacteria bacterium]|tara:strand:+ start:6334 stop:7209 length:876 start_codon:yes stop_codon:yes gene_type:complete